MNESQALKWTGGERTVAFRIYHDKFWVHVPELYYRTEADLAVNGRYNNGDKALDRQLMMNKIRIFIPVAGMCQYLEEGCIVELDDPRDSIIIYKLLNEHLQNWVYLSGTLNAPEPPLDDLRVMDRFAEILYPIAIHYGSIGIRDSGSLLGRLTNMGGGMERQAAAPPEQRPLLTRHLPQKVEEKKEEKSKEEHASLSAIIARQTFSNPWTK